MKIFVYIGHPAHVHVFKCAIWEWQRRGHTVIITARNKEMAIKLLDLYGFEYVNLGRAQKGLGLIRELIGSEMQIYRLVQREKPDVLIGLNGITFVHAGKLTGTPSVVFADTEGAWLTQMFSFPFANAICTAFSFQREVGEKQHRYAGYHELAYLHPARFKPDPAVLTEAGLKSDQRFFIIRFVSWEANHDIGQAGFSMEGKRELVRRLGELGRVIITSEAPLPLEFEAYRLSVSPTKMHDLLYYSSLYIGEGATMASEAAMLGIPSIYVNSLTAGVLEEQEKKYGLLHRIVDEQQAIEFAIKLVSKTNIREEYQQRRQRLLADKIDVTAWMVDFVERYPEKLNEYYLEKERKEV